MKEISILAAIVSDRKAFDRVDPHLEQSDVTPEGALILKAVRKFYNKDRKATCADLDIVRNSVVRGLANPKHEELLNLTFQRIADTDVSAVNVIDDVLSAKREAAELALAEAIHAKDRRRVDELIDSIAAISLDENLQGAVHEEYQGLDADGLIDTYDESSLIKLAPKSLNERVGYGVLPGTHIVIVAYPETGKTALVLTMIGGFVHQGLKVLYVGNEDPTKAIVRRFVSHLTRWPDSQIKEQPYEAINRARARGYDNVVFVGIGGGSLEDIKALCAKHTPNVLVVDQIRNIEARSENRTTQLEAVARGMRNLAREHDLVAVSVTQGADSSRDKLVLDMGDVDGSNVGIPGAADIMLMIGVNEDYNRKDHRVLTLAKNKVGGIHEHWPVGIRREHSAYYDFAG